MLIDTENKCAYVASATYNLLKELGYETSIKAAFGYRYEENEELHCLIHAVATLSEEEVDMHEEWFDKGIIDSWIRCWREVNNSSQYYVIEARSESEIIEFWKECESAGSPPDTNLIETIENQIRFRLTEILGGNP